MTIPSKSKKMGPYSGVRLWTARLLRDSYGITEWKQLTAIAAHRMDNRCSRERRKCKKYRGRKHSEAARAGCALASPDSRRNTVRTPPNPHLRFAPQPRQCPVQTL